MSKERPTPHEAFELTGNEKLYDRISHERFKTFLTDERTAVHQIEISTNTYGEFMFVTMSRPAINDRLFLTFWGLGYHESRERWLLDEWRWYETNQLLHMIPQKISPADAQALVDARLEEIKPHIGSTVQSARGRLFEMLADLTDEDGAYTELEDLGDDFPDWLTNDSNR